MTELGGNRNWRVMPTGNARSGILPESYLNFGPVCVESGC